MLGRVPAENKIGVEKPERNSHTDSLPNIWCISQGKGTDAPRVTSVTHLTPPLPTVLLTMDILDSPFDSPIQVEEMFLFESEENIGLVSSRGTGVGLSSTNFTLIIR